MKSEEQIRAEMEILLHMLSDPMHKSLTRQLLIRRLISALAWVIDDSKPVSELLKAMAF